jgi:DNA-binding Lrp family transcriptional regulator
MTAMDGSTFTRRDDTLPVAVPTALQRALINRYQGGFPLCSRPFAVVAKTLECSEGEAIEAVAELLRNGLLTRFGPLFDAARLGGAVTLAALRVPPNRFASVAQLVNALPQVAHNYRREHELNMWFVVASDRADEVARTLSRIEVMTGLHVYDFPKEREYHVGLWLQLGADGAVDTAPLPAAGVAATAVALDTGDRRLIEATQEGLPLTALPYAAVARELGLQPDGVIARLQRLLAGGVIRRIGVVPHHYRLGLRGNGMAVWDVDDAVVDELGQHISELDFVSHCYRRPRHARTWPYNLFVMAHGADRSAVLGKIARIEALLAGHCRGHEVLFSTTVLKKSGLRVAREAPCSA